MHLVASIRNYENYNTTGKKLREPAI